MQNDVYELTVYQSLLGQTFVNSMHVREAAAALTDAERQTTLQQVADNFKTMLKTNQINTLAYSTWRATQVLGSNVTWPAATCKRVGGRVLEGALTGTLTGSEAGGAPTPTFARPGHQRGDRFRGACPQGTHTHRRYLDRVLPGHGSVERFRWHTAHRCHCNLPRFLWSGDPGC